MNYHCRGDSPQVPRSARSMRVCVQIYIAFVRFRDTCREKRSRNGQVAKAQLQRGMDLSGQRKGLRELPIVAFAMSFQRPPLHSPWHHLAPALLRLIQEMYESPNCPRVLIMGPSAR